MEMDLLFWNPSFEDMKNISKSDKEFLKEISCIPRLSVSEMHKSKDDTIK